MNDELDNIISNLIKKKGGSQDDYRLLMDKIAFHESRLDARSHQKGGGPGRGKYQFEEGRYKGGKTASNRAINYYKKNNMVVPKWLKNLQSKESIDASKLSSAQQDILFLTNMAEHPRADLSKVMNGDESLEDFWANNHWSGKRKDRASRIVAFQESLKDFKPQETSINNKQQESRSSYRSSLPKGLFKETPKDNTDVYQKPLNFKFK